MKKVKIYTDKRRQKNLFNLFGFLFKLILDLIIPVCRNFVKDLKKFNQEHIYDLANTNEEKEEIKLMFNELFDYLYNVLENNKRDNLIYTLYLDSMTDEYNNNTTNARKVIDYISGMTDEFFLNEYKKIKEV